MNIDQQHAFLTNLGRGCTVSEAAAAARMSSSAFYALRKRDADFAEAWRLALEDSADLLEREAWRRAVDGREEPIVHQGQFTPEWERDERGNVLVVDDKPVQARNADGSLKYLTVRKPSDSLLALLLKGRRKDVFSDRTELTGANGGPVEMNPTEKASRIAALLGAVRARQNNEDLA
jgi:hypothetical protein